MAVILTQNQMKNSFYILALVFLIISCRDSSKNDSRNVITDNLETIERDYWDCSQKNGFVTMSKLTVKQLLAELEVKKGQKKELNILTTIGQTEPDWLTDNDLKYLISQIKSEQPAKCINRMVSSFIPDSKNMTIGNQVISIIEAYRKKESYPNELYICEIFDKCKVNEILEWYKKR